MTAWDLARHSDLAGADIDGKLAALIGDGAEGWPYLMACAAAPAPGVKPTYLSLSDSSGPVGFAPCFITPYEWLPSRKSGKAWPDWLKTFGTMRLASMGSTHANELGVRFDPTAPVAARAAQFEALIGGLEQVGADEDAQMLLVKDVNDRDSPIADPILRKAGYARMVAPPLAYLHLPFESADAYLAAFSHRKRKDILRNLKKAGAVTVETTGDIAALAPQFNALAAETRLRAGTQFGGLEGSSDGFFRALADAAPNNCVFTLFKLDGKLIGFSLMLVDQSQVFGKTIGLSYPEARDHKVYFRNLIEGIDLTARSGREWLCLGQLGYATKLHFGAKLEKRWYYMKLRGRYGRGFGLTRRFIEGRRIENESATYDTPERYFAGQVDGPLPPANLMFGDNEEWN